MPGPGDHRARRTELVGHRGQLARAPDVFGVTGHHEERDRPQAKIVEPILVVEQLSGRDAEGYRVGLDEPGMEERFDVRGGIWFAELALEPPLGPPDALHVMFGQRSGEQREIDAAVLAAHLAGTRVEQCQRPDDAGGFGVLRREALVIPGS